MLSNGPNYGYFINASKCFLLLKDDSFADSKCFKIPELMFVAMDVDTWDPLLALITLLYHFCLTIGMMNSLCLLTLPGLNLMPCVLHIFMALKANGLSCVILLLPSLIYLDTLINSSFLPTITHQTPTNNLLWKLLILPIREGGLGIVEPSKVADYHYLSSVKVTAPLVSILTHKSSTSILEVMMK